MTLVRTIDISATAMVNSAISCHTLPRESSSISFIRAIAYAASATAK